MTANELKLKSVQYRKTIMQIIYQARAGHTGGSLSCVDILNVLYNHVLRISSDAPDDPDRDRYVQSKGHSVEALYTVLADRGFFPAEDLRTLGQHQSHYVGHPTRKVRGIEHNTGALGHGLAVAVGMALAAKHDGRAYRVFTLFGDGELTEGSNWESAMAAAHYQLDNLVAIVDRNMLQITAPTEDVMALEPLAEKFAAFGFAVRECDGNDIDDLIRTFDTAPFEPGRPSLILAHTVKGKGVSFIENQLGWHHKVPSEEQLTAALAELDQVEQQLREGAIA